MVKITDVVSSNKSTADSAVQPNNDVTLGAVTATSFTGDGSGGSERSTSSTAPAGTWRLMGSTGYYNNGTATSTTAFQCSVWLRIA